MPEVAQEQLHPVSLVTLPMGSAVILGVSPGHRKQAGCTHAGAGSMVTEEMRATIGYICSRGQPLSAADVCTAQPHRARIHRKTDRQTQQHTHTVLG